jgi:threonine/homoserine/homoserine lactone efflux protein
MLISIASIFVVQMLGVMSPGPDFAMTTRNALVHGRPAGVLTALGITAGNLIHISYVTAGFAIFLVNSPIAYYSVMMAGGLYLLYFAWLCAKPLICKIPDAEASAEARSAHGFLLNGFITNITNVKCALYYIAVASRFMAPGVSAETKIVFGFEMVLVTAGWFSCVAFVLTDPRIRKRFMEKRRYIDAAFAAIITALAAVMLHDSAKGFAGLCR